MRALAVLAALTSLALAMPAAAVVPRESVEQREREGVPFGEHPVGGGPWILRDWKHDQYVEFIRNEEYWGTKPKLRRLRYRVIGNPFTAIAEFETGNISAIIPLPIEEIPRWTTHPQWKSFTRRQPLLNTDMILINCAKNPLDRSDVRRSLARSGSPNRAHWAGIVAALAFALTPAATLMFRFNNPDALMVFCYVAAAAVTLRAAETASRKKLALAGALVGQGQHGLGSGDDDFGTRQRRGLADQLFLVVAPGAFEFHVGVADRGRRRKGLQFDQLTVEQGHRLRQDLLGLRGLRLQGQRHQNGGKARPAQ